MNSVKISLDRCSQHEKNQQYLCFNMYCKQKIIKLCQKCIPNHQKHKQSIYKVYGFAQNIQSVYDCTSKVLNQAKQTHDKIENYIEKLKKLYKDRQDVILKKLLVAIQKEKSLIDQHQSEIEQIQKQLKQYKVIQSYFEKLAENNLLLIRLKMCSVKGHERFQQKHLKYMQLTDSSGQMKIINLFIKFFQKVKILKNLLNDSLQFKIQTLAKNSISKFSSIKDTDKTCVSEKLKTL